MASRGYSLTAVHGFLIVVAFLVAGRRLQITRASVIAALGLSFSSQAVDCRLGNYDTQA